MSSKLKPEPINRLTIKTGVVKGRKTNIKVEETKKSKKNFKNGVLSYDQKWRIYKSEIEPKLNNKVLEENEPNTEMLDTIKEALKETNVNIGKILRDTKKEPTDTHSDIITPSHIDTTLRDKLASAAENRIRTKDATDKLEGIFKRRNVQTQFQNGFNEAERKNAALVLEQYVGRNLIKTGMLQHGASFKEIRQKVDDLEKERDFLNKPINTGHIIEHQKELNKAVNKRKETLENKIKFGDVLNEIKSKEPKLKSKNVSSLNADITTLMKASLDKSHNKVNDKKVVQNLLNETVDALVNNEKPHKKMVKDLLGDIVESSINKADKRERVRENSRDYRRRKEEERQTGIPMLLRARGKPLRTITKPLYVTSPKKR